MRVVLVLGCFGQKRGDYQMCCSVENEILDITDNTERNSDIAKYLDETWHLFDKPLYTNVHTVLFTIQEKFSQKGNSVFPEKFYKNIEAFCIMHVKCGLFLRLRSKDDRCEKNK